jgi:hypothetical protein
MHPQKQYDLWAWAHVVLAIVFLIGLALCRYDYGGAPVKWCAGQVVDKECDERGSSETFTRYYIHANVGGHTGRVNVGGWEYQYWQVGQACEVAFRHGRFMDYDFTDIRHPASETRKVGWWAF